ncbi:ATP-binding protein [Candidatus Saccharibacteria bacterium]|nr:ATP-binding protein [Candidatus Saccharibacteria bacterium]
MIDETVKDAGTEVLPTIIIILIVLLALGVLTFFMMMKIRSKRETKNLERGIKMVPMLIHLPPQTDDIQGGGRDERDVTNEALSQAQVMYSIISSTLKKGIKSKLYGQRHISFEIIATNGTVKYYAVVPAVITETVKQAIVSAYPTARLEEVFEDNIFSKEVGIAGVAGGELTLQKEFIYPIATYEETKWDASSALLNAFSAAKEGEGMALQLLFRPTDQKHWTKKSFERTQNLRNGKKSGTGIWVVDWARDVIRAPFEPPEAHDHSKEESQLNNVVQEEISAIEAKTRFPGYETLIRFVASSASQPRSEALLGGLVSAFSQFNSPSLNGFKYDSLKSQEKIAKDFIFRIFPQNRKNMILNAVELASIFHLPSQSSIPNSQVERQATKQVDGPAKLVTEGILLGVNEFRGQRKEIRLSEKDRRRHTYIIGATGMGKSVLLKNIAYQDMIAGRGFAFIDPHGDVTEELLSMVPEDRIDDVIYFDPGDIEHPIGMNMFEWETEDQKDFIVQEGINMLQSLYDPNNQGFFGPRGQHMFRNAALLLMSDPNGATFIDIPRCFIDPEFVKSKLQYVTDKSVYDYWTKEFPASQKSNDAGEVITWFASKWGPFLSNTMMKNILGQVHSGFNIRDIMDNKKILLVNLSKGKMGEINSKLLGMIFVMKFQTAAMSRVDTPEDERNDFCLFVDEFQNFATESFESILSEARKFRLNLIVANQFMTQLTDKIREGLLGNVGTVICGRIGVTDAEIMEKVFTPTFNAEDLHNQPNFHAISTVMMFDMPSKPFTMSLLPPLSNGNPEVLESMKSYTAMKYGRTRAEVDTEINERLGEKMQEAVEDSKGSSDGGKSFIEAWLEKRKETSEQSTVTSNPAPASTLTPEQTLAQMQGVSGVDTAIVKDGPVFDNVVPDEEVEQKGGESAEQMSLPDQKASVISHFAAQNTNLEDDQVIKLR